MSNQVNLTKDEMQSKVDYIFSNSFNHTQHAYIDIAGDLVAGILLSQIMYWFSLDKNKKSKVRIFKDGNYWLAKGREDWFDEIRISPKQYDVAVKKLRDKELIETKLYKFNAVPTTHIRPIFKKINAEISGWKKKIENEIMRGNETNIPMSVNSDLPNGENGNFQSVNMEPDKEANSLTENTDNEYINRDYSTETTDNSLSADKDNSKSNDLELHNSPVSEETKQETRTSKTLGRKNHAPKQAYLVDMPTRAMAIATSFTDDTEIADKVSDCVDYFLKQYKARRHKEHIPLTNETLRRVVETMLSTITVEYENDSGMFENDYNPLVADNVDEDDLKFVIDTYFETNFREKTDYSLVHFTQDGVLTNIMNKCYLGGDSWYTTHSL